jgi:hypothetical protein
LKQLSCEGNFFHRISLNEAPRSKLGGASFYLTSRANESVCWIQSANAQSPSFTTTILKASFVRPLWSSAE